jgi:hypothetical protein
MRLKSIIYLSVLLFVACKTEVKKPLETAKPADETKKETNIESTSESEKPKDVYAEFASMFPVVDSFPKCSELLETSYDFDAKDNYRAFSRMVKWDFFTDASEYEWFYQPVLQYQYGDSAYVLVALEYDEESGSQRFHLIRRELTWNDHKEAYFLGTKWEIPIAEKRNHEIIKQFKFLNDSFDSVLIKQKNKPDRILCRFEDDFLDVQRFFKLTRNEMDGFPKKFNADSFFPTISNGWSAVQQFNRIRNSEVEQYRDFSIFIHAETNVDKTYTGYDVNYVPYVFPLGTMAVNDNLTLYVVYSDYFDNNEAAKTIKILLCDGDLNQIVDYKSFVWTDETDLNVDFIDNTFSFVRDNTVRIPLEFSFAGIFPGHEYFTNLISKIDEKPLPLTLFEADLMGQEFINVEGLDAFLGLFTKGSNEYASCFGKIETASQVLILLNSTQEITSGEHFVIDSYFASVFDKKSGAYQHNILLNSRFDGAQSFITSDSILLFPAGEEHYELIFGEDGNLYPTPTDTLKITNYGFVRYEFVFANESSIDSIGFLDCFKKSKTERIVGIEDFKCLENDTLNLISNKLNALIFNKKERFIVKYIPSIIKNINDSLVYLEWKRLDSNNYFYDSYDYNYIVESGVYNKNTNQLREIRKHSYIKEL